MCLIEMPPLQEALVWENAIISSFNSLSGIEDPANMQPACPSGTIAALLALMRLCSVQQFPKPRGPCASFAEHPVEMATQA